MMTKELQNLLKGWHQIITNKADYFGHKMHLDQNEKLVMYGCTTVLAIDGYSNMVLGATTMPVKNNVAIYKSVFRYYDC